MTDTERQTLINYLYITGKEKILREGASTVDSWAMHYVGELSGLGAHDKAEELYQLYKQKWGGSSNKSSNRGANYELGA